MARNKGQFPFSANFEVKNAAAIDPRVAVDTKAELINKETWPYDGNTIYLYDGLLVSVKDEKSIYMLVDRTKALASDYSGWQRVDVNAGKHIQNIEGKQPLTIKFDGGSTEGTNQFTYNVESAKNVNITPESINASRETHTHPTSISSNATTNLSVTAGGTTDTINDLYATYSDISNYLYLNPNNGSDVAQNDAVPANGRFAIYDVNTNTTAGGSDGYIMAFRWPSGNFATQVFLDADTTGIMALRHRDSGGVWTDWYRILNSSNIGSYALTPSNYTSYLDSRYMNASGDTMTGTLTITTPNDDILIFNDPDGEKYFRIKAKANGTDWGGLVLDGRSSVQNLYLGTTTDGYKVWHSGNDGSGSGLDADLLDGLHSASLRYLSIYNPSSSGVLVRTDISSNADVMFSAHIWGNTYGGAARPIDSRLEFYSYATNDAILEYSLQNNGCAISSVKVFCYNGYVCIWLPYIRTYMSYSVYVNTTNVNRDYNHAVEISSGGVPSGATRIVTVTPKNVALTTDNVASATKLANSRTLWGQPFDGMENVSGNMTGVGSISMNGSISGATSITATGEVSTDNAMFSVDATNITGDRGFEAYYSDKRIFCGFGSSGNYGIYTEAGGWIMSMHGSHVAIAKDSGHNVGIGTTTPAYKLDVNGSIRATSGFTGTLSGNASSATKLATARTITIGNTSKNFDGSANVSWTLSEIGAASSGHTHTTSASSNATTNLSITAGGTTATITDLYANYATSAGSVAWGNVTGKPSWIGSSKPSYSWSEITSKPSSFTPSAHTHDYLSGWSDTRGTAETPNSYNGVFEVKGIKQSSTYGISSGSYVQVFGYRGWSDSSGGRAHEFALADNGRIYHRDGSTTSWDSWDTVAYLSDIPSLSGYATQSWVKSQGYLTSAPSYSTATASKDGLVRIGFPESGKNYPVELNSNHQMYVNVPWTDTNTTYSLTKSGNTITLTGSDGKTTSVTDSNTTYSNATTSAAGLMSAADKTKLNNTPTFSYSNGVLTITT